jgi:hypothetical protein
MDLKNCVEINEILANLSDWTLRLDFQIVAGTFYAATYAFGILSNVFVIVAVIKFKNLLTGFFNEFVINLAAADLLICAVSLPANAYVDFYKIWPLGSVACRIIPFVQGLCVLVSSLTLSAIAVDRYFRILRRKRLDQTANMITVFVIWITACFVAIPLAINSDVRPGKRNVKTDNNVPIKLPWKLINVMFIF